MIPSQEQQHWKGTFFKREAVLAADIGGTNSNFALLSRRQKKWCLISSLHYSSPSIADFPAIVKEVLQHFQQKYSLRINTACFAGAGPVSAKKDFCEITHLPWNIDATKIRRVTSLRHIVVINDFDAVGYGIQVLDRKSFLMVKKGKPRQKAPKAVVGAGTGLGKSTLVWNDVLKYYLPLASEGGHADLSAQNVWERALVEHVKQKEPGNVAWEDAVSGKGLRNIYRFLGGYKQYSSSPIAEKIQRENYNPALITRHESTDRQCQDTVRLFLQFYARSAKNFALEVLPFGGLYIAGGIAAKHSGFFQRKEFIKGFMQSKTQHDLLLQIPVLVVKDYNVSLYGAAFAGWLYQRGELP